MDPERVEASLREARDRLPIPVIWLLGKTQSGKTSIVRALTRATRAEIGDGFRPCTRTASLYDFPDEDAPFLRFLDTRGLGEARYDPSEDLAVFQDRAHLLMIVVKAMDHALGEVVEAARAIRAKRPKWPILLVQTSIHEGYPTGTTRHPDPHPFDREPWPDSLPKDLTRSLRAQRELFADLKPRAVVVDLTLPEDGFEPVDYGLESLWTAIEEALPLGLRGMLETDRESRTEGAGDDRSARAHALVLSHAAAAGAAAATPVPYVDLPLVLGIQARMAHALGELYGRPMNARRLAELAGALGLGFLGRMGARELAKFVPGVGSAVAAGAAAATTYALGQTLTAYFRASREGEPMPDAATWRALYDREFARGRERLAEYLRSVRPNSDPRES